MIRITRLSDEIGSAGGNRRAIGESLAGEIAADLVAIVAGDGMSCGLGSRWRGVDGLAITGECERIAIVNRWGRLPLVLPALPLFPSP